MLRALWLWGNIYRKNSSQSCFKGSMGRECPAFGHKMSFCITLQQSHWMQSEIKRLSGHHIHGCLEMKRMWAWKTKSKNIWLWSGLICPISVAIKLPPKPQTPFSRKEPANLFGFDLLLRLWQNLAHTEKMPLENLCCGRPGESFPAHERLTVKSFVEWVHASRNTA